MQLSLKILSDQTLPPPSVTTEAAARGIENLVIAHLRARNDSRPANRFGLPKSNFYADAAKDVATAVTSETHATVEVSKPGVALHYFGATVTPKKGSALAIPVDPLVAAIWPSEYVTSGHRLFKTPGGALGDADTGKILFILVAKATIPADPTVLPSDDALLSAAQSAIYEVLS